ncbi:MAG: site-specific integrase [Syntrophorhabdales bacterium]|jgi:integrase
MTLQEGIKLFRTHQKSQAREKTRESYAYLLRNLETLFGETTVEAVSGEDIHQFLLIVTDGRARSSARLRYAQVKAFFNFLIENGKMVSNPCDDLMLRKTFRVPRYTDKDVVAREIVDEIIYRCKKPRNRLIMELQARCGLRIGEVLKLKVSDVNDRKLMLRKPKSGREQEVAFMPEAIATRLRTYISSQSLTGDHPLFPICYSTARSFIKKLGEKANVRIRPHDLRRHYATYASRNGVPLEVISKVILRHSDLKTTQTYLGKVTDAEAIRWVDVLHSK